MACTTRSNLDALLPKPFFTSAQVQTGGSHPLDIVARMARDADLAPGAACKIPGRRGFLRATGDTSEDEVGPFPMHMVLRQRSALIVKYAAEWEVGDLTKKDVLEKKLEELIVFANVMYGVCGLQPGKEFKADFFL